MRHPSDVLQRHNIFHHSYFLMKVAHIKFFIINKFKKNAKLGCGKLARKQVRYDRGLNSTTWRMETNASLIIRLWSKSQCFDFIQCYPTSLVIFQRLTQRSVYFHHSHVGHGNNTLNFHFGGSFKPTNIFWVARAVLEPNVLNCIKFTDFTPVNSFNTRWAASSRSSSI